MLLYIILNEQLICMKRPEYFSVLGSFHNLQVCPMLASVCFCDFLHPDQEDEESLWPLISFHLIYSKMDTQSLPPVDSHCCLIQWRIFVGSRGTYEILQTGVQFCFTNVLLRKFTLCLVFHSIHSCLESRFSFCLLLLSSILFFSFYSSSPLANMMEPTHW